ncbi:Uma2 family endonuclease [Pseudonocardia sp. GCM10023141]|uniref:Uma2 family endonuclease n=1 Tax=Pseudonocardia sp. GCM10023141 TaxID=3252653 RepID=UPI003609CD49
MPIPHALMTLAEWEALPEDNAGHVELQEGVLVVSPKPARRHQDALLALAWSVRQQLPPRWQALFDFEVVVRAETPAIVRAPDLVVVPRGGAQMRVAASEVLIAVEIISPGSRGIDTVLKPFEYAGAGIPHYWVVDLDPPVPSITVFGLGAPGDGYVESQRATGELVTSVPFPLRIDVAGLVEAP